MRGYLKVDPILVSKQTAAQLIDKDIATIDQLINEGKISIAVVKGEVLIPYRSLQLFAGVARWRFEQIEA